MPEEFGGKIFYSPEESAPVTPEEKARGEEIIERRIRELAEEEERKRQGHPPVPRKSVSGRFGRDDFDGTEYEQWAKDAWAAEDEAAANREGTHDHGE